jgi:hypothetical protein
MSNFEIPPVAVVDLTFKPASRVAFSCHKPYPPNPCAEAANGLEITLVEPTNLSAPEAAGKEATAAKVS